MNCCAVLASGTGSRMGKTDLPKQFVEVGNVPLICYTLRTVIQCGAFDRVYVGVSKKYMELCAMMIEKHFPGADLRVVEGGDQRMRTFFNIMELVIKEYPAFSDDDYMCLTDANRPLISAELYNACMRGAAHYGVCCPGKPVTDGICVVRNRTICDIPDKSTLYAFQTPECFRITDFLGLCPTYEAVGSRLGVTEIFSASGMTPHMVQSDDRSFKITTPIDFDILKTYLASTNG